jgi:hypothetical protein
MDLYQGFAISISGLSLLVSIWNYRKTLALNSSPVKVMTSH